MDKATMAWLAFGAAVIYLGFIILFLSVAPARSAEHNHPAKDAEIHEQFYSKWKRPDQRLEDGQRYFSCCNKEDCYPTPFRKRGDTFEFLHRETKQWMVMPSALLEHNQTDPIDSPDGQSHVCATPFGKVYCGVLGSGM